MSHLMEKKLVRRLRARIVFGILAGCFAAQHAAAADDLPLLRLAKFEHERASRDVTYVANWVVHSSDNHLAEDDRRVAFVILDKKEARVYVFDETGRLRGVAPALLGLGLGDTAPPGIGAKQLSAIAPKDRITPAGRFVSRMGLDTHGKDVLWLDYDGALAMHRVAAGTAKDRRLERLSSPNPRDKRISFGCINLPVKFYENVLHPAFKESPGIVYVLPETKPAKELFGAYDASERAVAK